jgi:uncharacterized protein YndB with AHSA1/START domain
MAERSIAAPAEEVYRYIADYRTHHPPFLPPAFSAFQVDLRIGVGREGEDSGVWKNSRSACYHVA